MRDDAGVAMRGDYGVSVLYHVIKVSLGNASGR